MKMIDFLNINNDYFINFKEFMAFFFIKRTFKLLSNATNTKHASSQLLLAGFRMLSMRLSPDDIEYASSGFNAKTNEDDENIFKAFLRALSEECLVNKKALPKKIAQNTIP